MQSLLLLLQLWAVSLGRTQGCVGNSECCGLRELERTGAWLSKGSPPELQPCHVSPQHRTASEENTELQCQGRSHGPPNSRAISPWRYREDCDNARFPRRLLQAECLCPHCVSLDPPHRLDRRGNSVQVNASTTVYYQRQCPGRPKAFYLEPQLYSVAVACICVVPRS
uniref:Interleukin 25 n=1 Tax=Pelusios castaneus TaxID=367368 RepID=A0A8C8RW48_9SAUR